MKLDFNINIAQKQGLTITAQVQQAIKLLAMTNLELCEFVNSELEDNPFVEEVEQHELMKKTSNDAVRKEIDKPIQEAIVTEKEADALSRHNDQFETGEAYLPKSTVQKQTNEFDPVQLVADNQKSLYAHCTEHVSKLNLNTKEMQIAELLIMELEPTGWLSPDADKIATTLHTDDASYNHVLSLLQAIEPAGLFSRDLKECLTLQAIEKNLLCENLKIVLDNLHLLGSGKFDLLKRRSGMNDGELAASFKTIKSFDPKPGLAFDTGHLQIREPDLIVKKSKDGWLVELNNSTLPDIKIKKDEARSLLTKVKDTNEKMFVKDKINQANWLANAIKKRSETLLKVGSEIVKRQQEFLESGASKIQPMILADIAEAIGMHESTISRTTTGSLMQTPQGTLEMKAFFSVALSKGGNYDETSAASLKFQIKKLIESEDPKNPLSDEYIVEIFAKKGIKVARRTVAKYRKLGNIPSSFARKRRNILAGL